MGKKVKWELTDKAEKYLKTHNVGGNDQEVSQDYEPPNMPNNQAVKPSFDARVKNSANWLYNQIEPFLEICYAKKDVRRIIYKCVKTILKYDK